MVPRQVDRGNVGTASALCKSARPGRPARQWAGDESPGSCCKSARQKAIKCGSPGAALTKVENCGAVAQDCNFELGGRMVEAAGVEPAPP